MEISKQLNFDCQSSNKQFIKALSKFCMGLRFYMEVNNKLCTVCWEKARSIYQTQSQTLYGKESNLVPCQ